MRLIIADDLTGANDTGVHFVSDGQLVLVIVDPCDNSIDPSSFCASTVVVNTNSRFLSPKEAHDTVETIVKTFSRVRLKEIYKKIDSTLRGNVGAEIDAVMEASGFSVACVAPAAPRNGRTVSDGICYVNGRPLSATEVAQDPFTPLASSDTRKIIATQTKRKIGLLDLSTLRQGVQIALSTIKAAIAEGAEIIVADSVTIEDLRTVRKAFQSLDTEVLYVGSAGFFHAVRESSPLKNITLPFVLRRPFRILMVVGSMMGTSIAQIQWLKDRQRSIGLCQLITSWAITNEKNEAERLYTSVSTAFSASNIVVLTTDRDVSHLAAYASVGRVLAQVVSQIIAQENIDALFVTGGDTAMYVLKGLAVNEFILIGELLAGIPVGMIELPFRRQPLLFISKAGSFGERDALEKIVEQMGHLESSVGETYGMQV